MESPLKMKVRKLTSILCFGHGRQVGICLETAILQGPRRSWRSREAPVAQ